MRRRLRRPQPDARPDARPPLPLHVSLEGRRRGLHELATLATGPGLERRLRTMLADWKGLLLGELPQARDVLRKPLVGPLRSTPVDDDRRRGYRFEDAVALDRLVPGVVDWPTGLVSLMCASWNQWRAWLRGLDGLRLAA